MRTRCVGVAIGAGLAGNAMAQIMRDHNCPAGWFATTSRASEAGCDAGIRGPVVASLTYDGGSTYGHRGQDYESVFDLYDIYCCETFSIDADANLTEFRSVGFGNGNPFGMTDFIVEIYGIEQLGEICDDGELPEFLLRSEPGAGFYDGVAAVTDFASQCLPAGDYVLRWAGELEFGINGCLFFFNQAGEHDNGGGNPNDGFLNNLGNAFGLGECFDCNHAPTGLPIGINFVLGGEPGDCGGDCTNDPTSCGDWDEDGDSDGDDFFGFLDAFASGDECADLDGDGDRDGDDFFGFLDNFINDC